MQKFIDMLIKLFEQIITAEFKFFETIYAWSFEQVARLSHVAIGLLPLWKQVLFLVVVISVVVLLALAGRELWLAGERILQAFTTLVVSLIRILSCVFLAGAIALLGLFIINDVRLVTGK